MKILIAGTIKRKVAKDITASRSRIIYEIASGLAKKGHEVSLLGTSDSDIPGVSTIPVIKKGFAEMGGFENSFYAETSYLVQLVKKIEEMAEDFDIVHNHTYPEFINLFAAEKISTPMLTTVHAQATPELDSALGLFPKANLVSISKTHKKMFKKANVKWVVYNGIDTETFSFEDQKDNYLLWIGRLGKAKDRKGNFIDAKGVRWAIKLAQETGERLIISGNVEDRQFFEKDIKPNLSEKIKWHGPVSSEQELTRADVAKLMQKAKAFLMTINWEEPFGLVMIEAMSCGTPVVAFNRGAVSEVVVDGLTGFVVDPNEGTEGLKKALENLSSIERKTCRKHVEDNFTITKMVNEYEKLYLEISK